MSYADWRERLGEANDPELYPLAHQDAVVSGDNSQFWATSDGAMITTIEPFPSGAVACVTYAAAGNLDALLRELKPFIEAWAKQAGCTHCIVEGRDGWRRTHPDYRHHKTILIKEL